MEDIYQDPSLSYILLFCSQKQGAYGKVQIFKEPLWKQLLHLDEVVYAFMLLVSQKLFATTTSTSTAKRSKYLQQQEQQQQYSGKMVPLLLQEDLEWCNDMLGKVSRSFAAVIRALPDQLMIDVLIFYLVLRALDTVEDDMNAFQDSSSSSSNNPTKTKIHLLRNFYKEALGFQGSTTSTGEPQQPQVQQSAEAWSLDGVGEGDELTLLQEFPRVQRIFGALSTESQTIIADITKRMGGGMAEMLDKDFSQGTTDVAHYNKYCHYVAGLVGEGLSRLFAQSGLEESYFATELYLSDQMGLFLQKTNIIRDYLEDYVEGRAFWPQSIWKKHTNGTNELGYFIFKNQTDAEKVSEIKLHAMSCLNEMVTNALEHVPACLAYLSELQCLQVFRFCAIPQVMAVATLEKCYGNLNVFEGVVKIRKGLACKLLTRTNNIDSVHEVFYTMAKSIEAKAYRLKQSGFEDPSLNSLLDACDVIFAITEPAHKRQMRAKLLPVLFVAAVVACTNIPILSIVLAVLAIFNYYFGPFLFQGSSPNNTNPALLVIPRLWKEVMGKKRFR